MTRPDKGGGVVKRWRGDCRIEEVARRLQDRRGGEEIAG
jgi:hypothetical protein